MVGSQFLAITKNAVCISDFTIVPAPGKTMDETYGAITLKTLTKSGKVDKQYSYINWAGPDGDQVAWVDGSESIVNDLTFAPGQAFWIQNDIAGTSLQCAGLVAKSDVTIELTSGGSVAIGNPFPTTISIQDLVVTIDSAKNNDPDALYGTITLKTLKTNGKVDKQYSYINWAGSDGDQIAWVDGSENIADFDIQPGQGFWVQVDANGLSIQFPAPEF